MNTLPSLSSLSADLILERKERHLSDLMVLLAKVTRFGWEREMAEVQEEILRAQDQKSPAVNFATFTDLSRLLLGFLRDVRLVQGGISCEKRTNSIWDWFKARYFGMAQPKAPVQSGLTTICLSQGSLTVC